MSQDSSSSDSESDYNSDSSDPFLSSDEEERKRKVGYNNLTDDEFIIKQKEEKKFLCERFSAYLFSSQIEPNIENFKLPINVINTIKEYTEPNTSLSKINELVKSVKSSMKFLSTDFTHDLRLKIISAAFHCARNQIKTEKKNKQFTKNLNFLLLLARPLILTNMDLKKIYTTLEYDFDNNPNYNKEYYYQSIQREVFQNQLTYKFEYIELRLSDYYEKLKQKDFEKYFQLNRETDKNNLNITLNYFIEKKSEEKIKNAFVFYNQRLIKKYVDDKTTLMWVAKGKKSTKITITLDQLNRNKVAFLQWFQNDFYKIANSHQFLEDLKNDLNKIIKPVDKQYFLELLSSIIYSSFQKFKRYSKLFAQEDFFKDSDCFLDINSDCFLNTKYKDASKFLQDNLKYF